jgi:hypothetical protein
MNVLAHTDSDGDLEEAEKIATKLEHDEEVLLVAKQSRIKFGSPITTASSIAFVTDRRVIIKSQTMLGTSSFEEISYDKITSVRLERGAFSAAIIIRTPRMGEIGRADETIDGIPEDKAEQMLSIIKEGMERARAPQPALMNQPLSVAGKLVRLSKLKEEGILSEAEFLVMKQELLK